MLSRAFTTPRKSPKHGSHISKSNSIDDYEDFLVGIMEDLPVVFCNHSPGSRTEVKLRELLRASVGVMGDSCLGMTEKVVMLQRKMYAVKRFRAVSVGRREFGRRVQRLAHVSRRCEHLVPVTAYLYAKRIKFVLCDYYPMGSLHDLLASGRKLGHTALDWNQRLMIIHDITRAITFIHTQSLPNERNMQMNIHGNIKSSNVMITVNFRALLSDYGFIQLAERVEISDSWPQKSRPSPVPENVYKLNFSQKSDIYNLGIIMLDILGGPEALLYKKIVAEKRDEIKEGMIEVFEFFVEGKERKQALLVLEIALECIHRLADFRPAIEQIYVRIGDIIGKR